MTRFNPSGATRGTAIMCLLAVVLMLTGCERPGSAPSGGLSPVETPAAVTPAVAGTIAPTRPTGATTAPTAAGTRQATAVPTNVVIPTASATRAQAQATPTGVPVQPTATAVAATATPTPAISGPTMTIKVFMIAEGDDGKRGPKVGCGDSVIGVDRTVAKTTAVLTASMKELVSIKSKMIGQPALYNAMYQSNLTVDNVQLVGTKATVRLKGQIKVGGTCDSPRVVAQIRYTALQFPTVKDVAILVNNVPIEQVLSQQ